MAEKRNRMKQKGLCGSAMHCSYGVCVSDSRYPEKSPKGLFFVGFAKPGKIKEGMTKWQIEQGILKTEKAKRWIHLCGRNGFTMNNIKKDTHICSLHFVGENGPTPEYPDPIKASLSDAEVQIMNKRRRPPRQKSTPIKMGERSSSKCSELSKTITPDKEMDGTLPYDMDKVDDSEIQGCSNMDDNVFEIDENVQILTSYVDDKSTKEESATTNTVTNLVDSSTQTVYNKCMLGAKIETIILKNKTLLGSTFEVNSYGNYSIHKIMASDQTCKYFTGLDTKQLEILYHFLGPAKYNLIYWNSKSKVDPSVTSSAKQFSIREQLMITLIRLRRGWNIFTLVHTYDTSDFVIRQIFTTWLQFMFHHFKDYFHLDVR